MRFLEVPPHLQDIADNFWDDPEVYEEELARVGDVLSNDDRVQLLAAAAQCSPGPMRTLMSCGEIQLSQQDADEILMLAALYAPSTGETIWTLLSHFPPSTYSQDAIADLLCHAAGYWEPSNLGRIVETFGLNHLNTFGSESLCPLGEAVRSRREDNVALLLWLGADVNAEATEHDKISDPAIKVAVGYSSLGIIKLLDAAGADWHQGGFMWVSADHEIHDRICHEKMSGHPDEELIVWLRRKWETLHPAE